MAKKMPEASFFIAGHVSRFDSRRVSKIKMGDTPVSLEAALTRRRENKHV
jgi:hypothetical protein